MITLTLETKDFCQEGTEFSRAEIEKYRKENIDTSRGCEPRKIDTKQREQRERYSAAKRATQKRETRDQKWTRNAQQ